MRHPTQKPTTIISSTGQKQAEFIIMPAADFMAACHNDVTRCNCLVLKKPHNSEQNSEIPQEESPHTLLSIQYFLDFKGYSYPWQLPAERDLCYFTGERVWCSEKLLKSNANPRVQVACIITLAFFFLNFAWYRHSFCLYLVPHSRPTVFSIRSVDCTVRYRNMYPATNVTEPGKNYLDALSYTKSKCTILLPSPFERRSKMEGLNGYPLMGGPTKLFSLNSWQPFQHSILHPLQRKGVKWRAIMAAHHLN